RQPDTGRFHARLGDLQYAAGQVGSAEESYRLMAALLARPESAAYYTAVGQAWLNVGEPGRSIPAFLQAAQIYDSEDVLNLLGQAYQRAGRLDEARDLYRRMLLRDPWDESGHLGLGQLHAARGEYESALREYRQALRLHPLANGAYSALGTIVQG